MKSDLHSWELDYRDAVELQRRLACKLIETPLDFGRISTVAGVDVSSSRRSPMIHCAVVLLDMATLEPVEVSFATLKTEVPYIPGLLSFREGPAALAAFRKLNRKPDAVIFDGQGYAHPRRLGLAAHMGLWLYLPTVGCAKTRLVGQHGEVPEKRWAWTRLTDRGETIGAVLRTRAGVKPVFVSRGHLCDLESAIALIEASCGKYRLPEPIRYAHRHCNEIRRRLEN